MEEIKVVSGRVWGYKQGEGIGWMIAIGDRLGLFDRLADAGPVKPADLAATMQLQETWLSNWMHGMAAAGLLEYDGAGPTFELGRAEAMVLANEATSPFFASGVFGAGLSNAMIDAIAESFSTGMGMAYDGLGDGPMTCMERMSAPMIRMALPDVISKVDGLTDRLRSGGRVLDIGCGAGMSLVTLAELFPACEFVGIEPSTLAVERARENAANAGVDVSIRVGKAEDLTGDEHFDLVLTLDCLHDMPFPERCADAVLRSLAPDGTWIVKELRAAPTFEGNQKNPLLALFYGFSLTSCMQCGASEPGGATLGNLGLHPEALGQLITEAGFAPPEMIKSIDPANLYFAVTK